MLELRCGAARLIPMKRILLSAIILFRPTSIFAKTFTDGETGIRTADAADQFMLPNLTLAEP